MKLLVALLVLTNVVFLCIYYFIYIPRLTRYHSFPCETEQVNLLQCKIGVLANVSDWLLNKVCTLDTKSNVVYLYPIEYNAMVVIFGTIALFSNVTLILLATNEIRFIRFKRKIK